MDNLKNDIKYIFNTFVGNFYDCTFDVIINIDCNGLEFMVYPNIFRKITTEDLYVIVNINDIIISIDEILKEPSYSNITTNYIENSLNMTFDEYCIWNFTAKIKHSHDDSMFIFPLEL